MNSRNDMFTFSGVEKWYEKLFEKLGWIVLAKYKNMDYKIQAYRRSIHNLMDAIRNLSAIYRDSDKLHDLSVLEMHVNVLHDFVEKRF